MQEEVRSSASIFYSIVDHESSILVVTAKVAFQFKKQKSVGAWSDELGKRPAVVDIIWFGLLGFMAYQPLKVI